MPYTAYDLVLQTTGAVQTPFTVFQEFPPIGEIERIGSEVWIGPLPEGISRDSIFDSCDPPGFEFRPVRQYGYRYSFVRVTHSSDSPSISWDEDRKLQVVIMLSRLVQPTTLGYHYSARAICKDGTLIQVVPGPTHGFTSHAWVSRDDWRDWLTKEDAAEIRRLHSLYNEQSLPARVRRAIRHFGHAQHTYFLDQRTASLVTSFESLLKTGRHKLTAKFIQRVTKLGMSVGMSINAVDAEQFYYDRSSFVHGSILNVTDEMEPIRIYETMETVLRRSLMKAISDPLFASYFEDDARIESQFA